MNKKILVSLIIILIILAGGVSASYLFIGKKAERPVVCTKEAKICSDGSAVGRTGLNCEFALCPVAEVDETVDWKTYQNDTYGFALKSPSSWQFRDGYKDYKTAGLNDFYQFCKSLTLPDPTDPHSVGTCNGAFLKIEVWSPTTTIETMTMDFLGLKLVKTEDVIINSQTAKKYSYSGLSQVDGLVHTWIITVLKTSDFIYSFTYSDNQAVCDQVISTFTLQCDVGYDKTPEAQVVSEKSPALITDFAKKCDGYYYFTFDYLGSGQGDPESGNGSYYTNTNLELRTFKADLNLKVKLTDNKEIPLETYVATLKKSGQTIFNQTNLYLRNAPDGQPVFSVTVQNGLVISMGEVYLP